MWIIQPQRCQTSQSTLLGETGGFQRINGGLGSWRDKVTPWVRVQGRRALRLKRSWAGGKGVRKSWRLVFETAKVLAAEIWQVATNMEHQSDTCGESLELCIKSWGLFQLRLSYPKSWRLCEIAGEKRVRCLGPKLLRNQILHWMEKGRWDNFYIVSQEEKTSGVTLGLREWSYCSGFSSGVPIYACWARIIVNPLLLSKVSWFGQ